MKIIKGIAYGLIGLLVAITAFIFACAFNPKLSETISAKLYGRETAEEEKAEESKSKSKDEDLEAEPTMEPPKGENPLDKAAGKGETVKDPAMERGEGEAAPPKEETYIIPSEEGLSIPDNVAGKTGYQPINEEASNVSDEEAKKLTEELGYGQEGDGLEFDQLFYPYYHMLDDRGKHLYRQLYANSLAFNKQFKPVESLAHKDMLNAFMALYNDHPELFWLDSGYGCKYKGDGSCVEVDLTFNSTADDYENAKARFEAKAKELKDGANALTTDYGKEQYVHDKLIDNVDYQLSSAMNQSAYSALVNGSTVCAGYSRAMQYVMQELGIPCYYCTGYAGENHAWNIVALDDGYYNVDVTWDDNDSGRYDYFNKSDSDYAKNHVRRELSVYLPPCNGSKYRTQEEELPEPTGTVTEMRSLEDIGKTQDDVINTLNDYYYDCYNQIIEKGVGEYSFENLIGSETLLNEIYNAYSTKDYTHGYMDNAVKAVNAGTYDMDLLVEELQGHIFRLTHRIKLGF
ncbi:MAG: hypothetical protein K5931_10815 [Lachnospiraceae bacterium]|nr:hypothetical protein [Lachnospiraceae bacterium]